MVRPRKIKTRKRLITAQVSPDLFKQLDDAKQRLMKPASEIISTALLELFTRLHADEIRAITPEVGNLPLPSFPELYETATPVAHNLDDPVIGACLDILKAEVKRVVDERDDAPSGPSLMDIMQGVWRRDH